MKVLIALALVSVAAADVSHLFPGQYSQHHQQHEVQYQPQQYQAQTVQTSYVKPVAILQQVQETSGLGDYKYNFKSENGIEAASQGQLKNAGTKDEALVSEGSYSYVGDDGQTYTVNWVADEFGFRASGAHIPKIPAEIQRSLELNAQQQPQETQFQQFQPQQTQFQQFQPQQTQFIKRFQ